MPPPPEEDVNYTWEMVKHPLNGWALCAGLVLGSIGAVVTGIAPLILVPAVLQAGVNGLMALVLPESVVFREGVDQKRRAERREAIRVHLVNQIKRRAGVPHKNWETYWRMVEQLASLRTTAKAHDTSLSLWDVERLDQNTVNFLRLWLARLTVTERQASTDVKKVRARAREIQRRLEDDTLGGLDRNRLTKALADLDKILVRRESFELQDTAMAASMLSMADGFSEVYHRIMSNPSGQDVSSFLDDAVDRMNVTEELDFAADLEIDEVLGLSRRARAKAATSLRQEPAEAEEAEAMRPAEAAVKSKRRSRTRE